MAVQKKFTQPLQVVETPEKRERIEVIADREGVSQASVIRDMIEHGLEWREALSLERVGS